VAVRVAFGMGGDGLTRSRDWLRDAGITATAAVLGCLVAHAQPARAHVLSLGAVKKVAESDGADRCRYRSNHRIRCRKLDTIDEDGAYYDPWDYVLSGKRLYEGFGRSRFYRSRLEDRAQATNLSAPDRATFDWGLIATRGTFVPTRLTGMSGEVELVCPDGTTRRPPWSVSSLVRVRSGDRFSGRAEDRWPVGVVIGVEVDGRFSDRRRAAGTFRVTQSDASTGATCDSGPRGFGFRLRRQPHYIR
jgi:hypothetical protein